METLSKRFNVLPESPSLCHHQPRTEQFHVNLRKLRSARGRAAEVATKRLRIRIAQMLDAAIQMPPHRYEFVVPIATLQSTFAAMGS